MVAEPKTLAEATVYFADAVNCREFLVARRWPNGVTCPRCGSKDVQFDELWCRWKCRCPSKHDARQFTLRTGTIMEGSPISLDKWLLTMWKIVNCRDSETRSEPCSLFQKKLCEMLGKGSHADCQLFDFGLRLDTAFLPTPFKLLFPVA
jgi:hypothetical protein